MESKDWAASRAAEGLSSCHLGEYRIESPREQIMPLIAGKWWQSCRWISPLWMGWDGGRKAESQYFTSPWFPCSIATQSPLLFSLLHSETAPVPLLSCQVHVLWYFLYRSSVEMAMGIKWLIVGFMLSYQNPLCRQGCVWP